MIQKLKEETRELHEEVEEQNLARQIMDHSIDLATYKLLLYQNYLAYEATETAIKDFLPGYSGKKHEYLAKDLKHLGVSLEEPSEKAVFRCQSKAEALGAAYVVEGSALGGMLLARNLKSCSRLSTVDKHYFFNGNKENLKEWNSFKEQLEQYTFSEVEEKEAIDKARDTFKFFQAVFNRNIIINN